MVLTVSLSELYDVIAANEPIAYWLVIEYSSTSSNFDLSGYS